MICFLDDHRDCFKKEENTVNGNPGDGDDETHFTRLDRLFEPLRCSILTLVWQQLLDRLIYSTQQSDPDDDEVDGAVSAIEF